MTNKVPFLDVGATYRELKAEIDEAIQRVLDSGWYILSAELTDFEISFSEFIGSKHAIGVGSGLDALSLALQQVGIGNGDEVVVPAHTFIATYLAVSEVGAIPIPVDVDINTGNIVAEGLDSVITNRTKAIIPVHIYGVPCELDEVQEMAELKNLSVIEDAAQAHGATYKGKRIGSGRNLVAWSFYPGKNLGAFGDGGAITTNSDDYAERIRMLRNYGSRQKYLHEEKGRNSRLDPVQAAILSVKLGHLADWNRRRQKIASFYLSEIENELVKLPTIPEHVDPVWHLFVIRSGNRHKLQRWLSEQGIETAIHYPTPPHLQPAYREMGYKKGSFPNAEKFCESCLSLPIGPHLSESQANLVVEAVNSFHE